MLCISLGFPDSSVGKESTCNAWVRKIHWRRDRLLTPVFLGFHSSSAGKESACNTGDLGSVPGLERYPGQGKGYPLQYSSLENTMACRGHGVTESDMTFTFTFGISFTCTQIFKIIRLPHFIILKQGRQDQYFHPYLNI